MDILDQLEQMKKIDTSGMLETVQSLEQQSRHAWENTRLLKVPKSYRKAQRVAVFGMGGSALGAHVVKTLFADQLSATFEIINDYTIPTWIDKETFVILSSYSGTTEETVTVAEQIHNKTDKVAVIATGGRLQQLAQKNNWPAYIIDPKFNLSGQPRMAVGYSVVGQIGLLERAGLLTVSDTEMEKACAAIAHCTAALTPDQENAAKEIARAVKGKIPLFIGSDFLAGNMHTFSNQINESAKNFSTYFLIPELNHHLLEGLENPKELISKFVMIFFPSQYYHSRVEMRYEITREVAEKNGLGTYTYHPHGESRIEQSFEILTLGGHAAFYLAMLSGINPTPIPWVDYFKDQLEKK